MQTVSSPNLKQDMRTLAMALLADISRLTFAEDGNRRSAIPRGHYFIAHGAFARHDTEGCVDESDRRAVG